MDKLVLLIPVALLGVAALGGRRKPGPDQPDLPEERGNFIEGPLHAGETIVYGVIVRFGTDVSTEDLQYFAERMLQDATTNMGLTFQLVSDPTIAGVSVSSVVQGDEIEIGLEDPLEFDAAYDEALVAAQVG